MEKLEVLHKEYEEYKKQGRIWGSVPKEIIKKIKYPRVDKKIIEAFSGIPDLTSTVSDVLDSLGINGAVPASFIRPVISGKTVIGTAVTIRNIPERKTATQGYVNHDFIRMATRDIQYLAEDGDVLIIDGGGGLEISNVGGQSCMVTKACGLAGTIVNGSVRDIQTIRELDHPVWSCGVTPITGKYRIEAIEINGPVTLHTIQVIPGDLVIADDCGVCVIPHDAVETVLQEVKNIITVEAKMEKLVLGGASVEKIKKVHKERYK